MRQSKDPHFLLQLLRTYCQLQYLFEYASHSNPYIATIVITMVNSLQEGTSVV